MTAYDVIMEFALNSMDNVLILGTTMRHVQVLLSKM